MAVKRSDGQVSLIVIEWKYTECYSNKLLVVSKNGTNRVDALRIRTARANRFWKTWYGGDKKENWNSVLQRLSGLEQQNGH
jgi:hypothetical protein